MPGENCLNTEGTARVGLIFPSIINPHVTPGPRHCTYIIMQDSHEKTVSGISKGLNKIDYTAHQLDKSYTVKNEALCSD